MLAKSGWERYDELLVGHECLVSAATRVELGRFFSVRQGLPGVERLRKTHDIDALILVPVDERQAEIAIEAALAYGTGRGRPPAVPNYGDLFAYALAEALDLPLLFEGDDFARTDARSAVVELP